ncbi:acyl-CoA dehydrogenase family protein [Kordiimonas gwangyangensis]|uniref:acyl-CoA dehydrogenase family protein n=1 Tax=Kordiimonas gwangyangensis TaxID=288022 RepID=UPI00036F22FF|nr:acyl-CoA dehydrogenase family protein [Kordiimonas gwangyangensis]
MASIPADKSYLNWPFFDDHHRVLARELDAWAAEYLPPIVDSDHAHADVDSTCRILVHTLGAGGWLRYAVPKAYGGMHEGLDVRSLCIIRETLARYSGLADFAFAMQGLGSGAITLAGSEELKAEYLPQVASGQKIAAFALTEPEAGSDVAQIAAKLKERKSGGYKLKGEKTYISNGGIADFYCTFARTGEAPGARGLSAIVVDADTPGFSIKERIEVIAPHPLGRLAFDGCELDAGKLIGKRGEGFKLAMATLDIFRSTVGAAALGFARRALAEAIGRTKSRQLFGAPLADLPITQERLAEMALDIDASALLIYRAAWTKDSGAPRVTREAAMAKLHATDSAQTVIDKALQMFGGMGVTKGVKVEELYREIRALRIYEGASEVQKLVIARQLLAD